MCLWNHVNREVSKPLMLCPFLCLRCLQASSMLRRLQNSLIFRCLIHLLPHFWCRWGHRNCHSNYARLSPKNQGVALLLSVLSFDNIDKGHIISDKKGVWLVFAAFFKQKVSKAVNVMLVLFCYGFIRRYSFTHILYNPPTKFTTHSNKSVSLLY